MKLWYSRPARQTLRHLGPDIPTQKTHTNITHPHISIVQALLVQKLTVLSLSVFKQTCAYM